MEINPNFPVPVGKKVIMRAIPTWRELGSREWVTAEEARYVCPECSHQIFRGAKRCNKCKNSLDLDEFPNDRKLNGIHISDFSTSR